MSRHNKDHRKYRCPCGNPFSTVQVETMEEVGVRLHSCGRCCKLSVREAGRMRYMTADEAMKHDLPDCIGMIPLEKP